MATEDVFRPDILDLEKSGTVLWVHSYIAADMYMGGNLGNYCETKEMRFRVRCGYGCHLRSKSFPVLF